MIQFQYMERAPENMRFSKSARLAAEGNDANPQEVNEQLKPKQIITAKGSVYSYLPDGRTQRYKAATGETFEPTDVLVFVPPWEKVEGMMISHYPEVFERVTDDFDYEQLLLRYVQLDGKRVVIIDQDANQIKTQEDADAANRLFLAFIDTLKNTHDFSLPVAKDARIGFQTFDASYMTDDAGVEKRSRHLGNKVVEITY